MTQQSATWHSDALQLNYISSSSQSSSSPSSSSSSFNGWLHHSSPVSIQTQSLALRKRKPQETQALAIFTQQTQAPANRNARSKQWQPWLAACQRKRLRLNWNRAWVMVKRGRWYACIDTICTAVCWWTVYVRATGLCTDCNPVCWCLL